MKQFSDLGIKPKVNHFTGDKIRMDRIINRKITVCDYKIEPSKFQKTSEECLHLQVIVEGNKHVVFTGSKVLIDMIQQASKDAFPFETTIIRENERFVFT